MTTYKSKYSLILEYGMFPERVKDYSITNIENILDIFFK